MKDTNTRGPVRTMAQVEPYSWGDVPTSSGGATRDLPAWMPQPPPQTGAGGAGTFVPPPCFPPVTTPPDIDVDRIRISEGYYAPGFLGPTPAGDVINPGVNFAIHSAAAAGIDLLIYFDPSSTSKQPSLRIPLDPKKNKTGDVWHVRLDNIPRGGDGYVIRYGYLVDGGKSPDRWDYWEPNQLMVDPYAPLVEGRRVYGENESCPNGEAGAWMGAFALDETPFDWSGVEPPNIPPQDLVVYECTPRAFTASATSGLDDDTRGSFLGIAEKVAHIKDAGYNAVELLPVFHFDEMEFQLSPNPRDHMLNTWGYSTMAFFAPMTVYASKGAGPQQAAREFKHLVKTMHANGIEVLLDVVYNHTGEGSGRFFSFRGIDNKSYYMMEDLNGKTAYKNYTGCGNTFNCNHEPVTNLVLDSLRHWVEEYHVDGFRFDLTSCLCRDPNSGAIMTSPPVVRAIAKDNTLSRCKLFAEPWDCSMDGYLVGKFPNWDRWGEWNGIYRDTARRFLKGDPGLKSQFASSLCGSADMYAVNARKPYHSLNFITAHDGFTLRDLVSYNKKANHQNGEEGRDGCNDNHSWNCGQEGECNDQAVTSLRWRQMRNMHLALMVSQGTPMVLMGDEYGHTRKGNNNTYGHDNELNNFDWSALEAQREQYFRYHSGLVKFRLAHPLLGRAEFLNDNDITWHEDNWDNPDSLFLAYTLHDCGQGGGDLYIAFNQHDFFVDASLPPPPGGKSWHRVVDTNLPPPNDFIADGEGGVGARYNVAPRGAVMLVAK